MTIDPDEQLLDELRAIVARTDPVPAHVDEAARAAFGMRSLDELARLLLDSETAADSGMRGTGETRMLSFGAGEVGLELQVDVDRATATLRGLLRGAAGPVTVEGADGIRHDTDPDEQGWFVVREVALGRTRLRVASASVITEWFVL